MTEETRHSSFFNLLSLGGAVLATVSGVVFLIFLVRDLTGAHTNPYYAIVTFLILPALFIAGLFVIPLGIVRTRRRMMAVRADGRGDWPIIDLQAAPTRRIVGVILVMTIINVVVIALAAYQSLDFVDSRTFCTGVCHTPMEPQAAAHQRSVHASISCSSCHVGEGPPGFLRAKLGGVRRLAAVATGDYRRPIPAPVSDLPVAAETCQQCHNREKYFGELIRQVRYYSDDETTSEQITTLAMQAGGGGWDAGGPHGIHWHASPHTRVEYIATDDKRETIPWVKVSDRKGVREFAVDGVTPEQLAAGQLRVMDCTDCHNRQGHAIAVTLERAVDEALARGLIPRTLPFVRREVLAALQDVNGDRSAVERSIAERLSTFYSQKVADGAQSIGPQIAQAIAAAQRLYVNNVFPRMNVRWGTYPTNLGHTDAPGCFRCHDDQHKTSTGAVIGQDCETCHKMQ